MPVTLSSVDQDVVPRDGGYELTIRGTFTLGLHRVHVGPNGDSTDPMCLSGKPEQVNDIYPLSTSLIRCYTPLLDVGAADVYVEEVSTSDDDVLSAPLTVIEPVWRSSSFDIRKVLPPNYKLGPRTMEQLHRVGNTETFPKGLMEAVAAAIGDADTELGGFFQTRLTSAVSSGATTLPVESTYRFSDSGKVAVEGVVYDYTGKTNTTLTGVTHIFGGSPVSGTFKDHTEEAVVVNVALDQSDVELLRNAMLVDYAEGEDLSAIGRNIGVNRRPFLSDDDRFREVIKHLGYNPRGTVYGLELALTGLLGTGNFEIVEDLIKYPNTVFIKLTGTADQTGLSEGKTYLRGAENRQSDSVAQVTVGGSLISRGLVRSVMLADENHTTDCRTAYPSADSKVEYVGDPGTTLWLYFGTGVVEGTHVTQITGNLECIEFTLPPPTNFNYYFHTLRSTVWAKIYGSMLATIPSTSPNDTGVWSGLGWDDGSRLAIAGVQCVAGASFRLGFANSVGSFISGFTTLTKDQFYDIAIRKDYFTSDWELLVDGKVVQTMAYASASVTLGTPAVGIGHLSTSAANTLRVKQVSYYSHDPTDYWSLWEANGVAVNPDIIQSLGTPFLVGDVGKKVRTWDNVGSNPINNGDWEVYQFDSTSQIRVRGSWWPGTADLGVGATDRVTVSPTNPQLFTYPDDIGKSIEIQNSSSGNDGTYVITGLLQQGTLVDLSTFDTQNSGATTRFTEKTNVAVVSGGPFTPENDTEWRLLPAFAASGMYYQMPDAGSVAGSVLSLRGTPNLPYHPIVVSVHYAELLSAHLMFDEKVRNSITVPSPLELAYYPFYLGDPLGFIKAYIDDITAAGVIAEYTT